MVNRIEGNIVDIYTRNIFPCEIIVKDGIISEINRNENIYPNYIIPGLIDSHIHIESSLLIPARFAEIAVQHGTIAAVSDPHEIANVCGIDGIEFMLKNAKSVPFYFAFGAPSCVPSTSFESNGAIIGADKVQLLFEKFKLNYLSEVMNYPGVINEEKEIIDKIKIAINHGKKIDGHAPELKGKDLTKYASFGIDTDHECSSIQEAEEKINLGFKILIREGSAARNFDTLAPLIDKYPDQVMLCTDDFHPDQLVRFHINELVRRGVDAGIDLFNLLRAASINPIIHYNLPIGSLKINDSADFAIVNDLKDFKVMQTWVRGKPVYAHGNVYFNIKKVVPINNFHTKYFKHNQFIIKAKTNKIRTINLIEGELITTQTIENAKIESGECMADPSRDILKLVVINRYLPESAPAIGFVKNFGLKSGAIASSISHDSHNIIAIGTNEKDLLTVVNAIISHKGGLAACEGENLVLLELEIAGLMSQMPAIDVAEKLSELNTFAWQLGSKLKTPFMALSFLSLIVIPHLKMSDKGLFDVDTFSFTDLFAE